MVVCSFCGSEIKKGSGKIFVKDNGIILNFCSSKCENNMLKLKRDARKFKWTKAFVKGEAPSTEKKVKVSKKKTTTTKVVKEAKTASKK